jgi:hypothetical protein
MRYSFPLCGIVAAIVSASAIAQPVSGTDNTNLVKSNDVGMPGQSTNPTDQLVQRQALQDLSNPEGKKAGDGKLGSARPATKGELALGAIVNDKSGAAMAKIEEIDADGVVVSMGAAKVKVPAEAFGHNKAGLLLDLTKAQFEQVVAHAGAAS